MEEEIESDDDEDVVFAKAREFLRIVQSQSHIGNQNSTSSETQTKDVKRTMPMLQFGVPKLRKLKTVKSTDSNISITPSQRKKLERVKVSVTSFIRTPTQNGCSEKEEVESVKNMLEHMRRLPQQEIYSPPQLPMVSIDNQNNDEDISVTSKNSFQATCTSAVETLEFSYLTAEQDLTTWELLRSSPTNCNVFVGNLSYNVDKNLLLAMFQPFAVEQQKQNIKVRIVTNVSSGASKGYGFVKFPYRRAAELAMICMQGFQIFDREIQLGWGQKELTDISQTEKTAAKANNAMDGKRVGSVISDSHGLRGLTPGQSVSNANRKTRWDIQACVNDCSEKFSLPQVSSEQTDQSPGSNKMERVEEIKIKKVVLKKGYSPMIPDNLTSAKPSDALPTLEKDNEMSLNSEYSLSENNSGSVPIEQGGIASIKDPLVNTQTKQKHCIIERKIQSRVPLMWLTKAQRIKMIKSVCENLRKSGVKHHLGVFGRHFEADNSRLFVLCCKTLTHQDLKCEFEKYGTTEININKDTSGLSKGSAIVQYVSSMSAEIALKKLHGKMLGGKPLTVKVAEPKKCTH